MSLSGKRLAIPALQVHSGGEIKINGIVQWRLLFNEEYSGVSDGWNDVRVTECGDISLLGGYCVLSD